jgi:hypothetical protein
MKKPILLSLASVLCAGLMAGCSSEVHNPHQESVCPTDFIASWGQDVYYGGSPCFMDGHQVPVNFPRRHGESVSVSTSGNASVAVSGSAGR